MRKVFAALPVIATCCALGTPAPVNAAPSSLGELAVVPQVIPVGAPIALTATIRIPDTDYIDGSAALFASDANGRLVRRLGLFVDSGTQGDRVAGDRVFTIRWTASEAQAGILYIKATAAFRGTLLRIASPISIVEVATDADVITPKALLEGSRAAFLDAAGNVVREVVTTPIEESRLDPTTTARTVRSVVLNEDQTRLGLFETRETAPVISNENLEFDLRDAVLKIFSGRDGELASISAPDGKSFFVPAAQRLFSRRGDRVGLAAAAPGDVDVTFYVYNEVGALLYQSPESFPVVRDVALSPDGRFLAYIVSRNGSAGGETLFRVIEVDSRREWQYVFDDKLATTRYMLPALAGFALFINGAAVAQFP